MRRLSMFVLSSAVLMSNFGCAVVVGNRIKSRVGERYPVVVNGEIYLVDAENATSCKVPTNSGPCEVDTDDKPKETESSSAQ